MKQLLFFVGLFLLPIFFFELDGAIGKDIRLRGNDLQVAGIATSERKCKTKVFVFHSCSYKYVAGLEDHRQSYAFLALSAPETVTLLRDRNSGLITSDVGQDYLFNRIFTIAFFALLFLFLFYRYTKNALAAQAGNTERGTHERAPVGEH